MNKRLMKKAAVTIVAAGVILGGISVYADSKTSEATDTAAAQKVMSGFMRTRGADFSAAVADGIISQSAADKIEAYMEKQSEARKAAMDEMKDLTPEELKERFDAVKTERVNFFEALVTEGIITQQEAEALKEYMSAHGEGFMGGDRAFGFGGMNLDTLIEKGIIDDATAAKMKEYMSNKAEEMRASKESRSEEMRGEIENRSDEMKALKDEIKNMTDEERKEFFESNKESFAKVAPPEGIRNMEEPIDIISEMVSEGIITEAQAEAIKELMPQRPAALDLSDMPDMPNMPNMQRFHRTERGLSDSASL